MRVRERILSIYHEQSKIDNDNLTNWNWRPRMDSYSILVIAGGKYTNQKPEPSREPESSSSVEDSHTVGYDIISEWANTTLFY